MAPKGKENNTKQERLSDVSDNSTASTVTDVSSCTADNIANTFHDTQSIRVVTRVRPLSTKEINERAKESVKAIESSKMIQVDKSREFYFDSVFGPSTTQKQVYDQTAGDMIRNNLFKGFNVTVLAYGQTGSGKTHTIFGGNGNMISDKMNDEVDGVIPRAVHDVFHYMDQIPSGKKRMKVQMSYLEIYNEEARDLLSNDPSPPDLQIRDNGGDVIVQNLTYHSVSSPSEVAQLMAAAAEKRSTASTLMNAVSSRSHAICTLYVNIYPLLDDQEPGEEITAKLTLVDLAGSERAKKTGAEGTRLKEGININKGLFVLGQVVSSLSELGQNSASCESGPIHVKYRDSKLTRLLQDSLGGNSKTVMVACVSPADSNVDETVNTLRYAERTRNIKNSAIRNVVVASLSPAEAASLRRENQMLKLKLFQAEAKISSLSSLGTTQNVSMKGETPVLFSNFSEPMDSSSMAIVDNDINGLDLKDLDIMTRLKANCTSMEEKLCQHDEKYRSLSDDCLEASLRADKWQSRCESLVKVLNENRIEVQLIKDIYDKDDNFNIIQELRQEVMELKDQLKDAVIDAEVSRSIAALLVKRNGDLSYSDDMPEFNESECSFTDDKQIEFQKQTDFMSTQLIAMSGSIEQKEEVIRQIYRERELMESMKSHFENALHSLQEEVTALSTERDILLTRLNKDHVGKDDTQTQRLQERTRALETRIKELKEKANEHTKSLRLHSQAEKKCQKLEAELASDKKKRAELQRLLKKECAERREEKKKAMLEATKLLRDSQRLKLELNKVKEAAAKQENVLRRKAAEAMHKQKLLAERSKKRVRGSGNISTDLSSQRKEELNSFIEKEIENSTNLCTLKDDIEENRQSLEEAEERREFLSSQKTGDEVSSLIRSLDYEIELRSKIIEQLERNIGEIYKSANRNPNSVDKNSSLLLDTLFWQTMSRPEVRYVSQYLLSKLVEEQLECNHIKKNVKEQVERKVNAAVEKEKWHKEKELLSLKVQHSQDINNLLESTKETIRKEVLQKIAPPVPGSKPLVGNEMNVMIDDLLKSYLNSCTDIGTKVKSDLECIKADQDGVKSLVDNLASELIYRNDAKVMQVRQQKKYNIKKKEVDTQYISEFEDEPDADGEDGEDSEWSPDTPIPNKKKHRSSFSEKDNSPSRAQDTGSQENYEKMTVVQLRELLRKNGLTVSGKKSELIQRLEFYGDKKAKEVVTASARKRERPTPLGAVQSDITLKKIRLLSPAPSAKKNIEVPAEVPSATSRTKTSSVMTSSTKASDLRRRTPTETETAQLITKRSTKKSPKSARVATKTRKGITAGPSYSRTLSRTTGTKAASSTRVTEHSNRIDAPKKLISSSSRTRTSTESTSSISSVENKKPTVYAIPTTTTTSNTKSVSKVRHDKTGKKSTTPQPAKNKIRIGGVLSNVINSAKKRKIARRQDMAKSVTAALAELEKLQDVL